MKHEDEEFLSGLMDGEWRTLDVRRSVRTVCEDEALRAKWSRYHLARQAMKREPVIPGDALAERVSRAIDDEPTYSNVTPIGAVARPGTGDVADEPDAGDAVDGPAERPLADEARMPVAASAAGAPVPIDVAAVPLAPAPATARTFAAGFGLAASVAVVTAFGLNALDGGSPVGGSGPVADAAAPVASSGPVASAPPDPFSRQVPGAPLPNVELVANPRPDGAYWTGADSGARRAESEKRLNMLLSRHIEQSPTSERQGMLPYSRLVGYSESAASGGSAGGLSAGSAPDR